MKQQTRMEEERSDMGIGVSGFDPCFRFLITAVNKNYIILDWESELLVGSFSRRRCLFHYIFCFSHLFRHTPILPQHL